MATEGNIRNNKPAASLEDIIADEVPLEKVLDTIGDGISLQDRELKIIYANNAQRRLFGEGVVGRYCYEVYEKREGACDECPVARAMETGEPVHDVRHATGRDGNRLIVDIVASPIMGARGNIIAGVEVVRDITAQYQVQQELAEKTGRLERLAAVAREVSSGLDLKQVLERVARNAVEMTGADAGTVAILDTQRKVITYPYHYNMPEELQLVEVPEGAGIAGAVIASREPIMLADYGTHEAHLKAFRDAGVVGIIAVPLIVGERSLGALGLFTKDKSRQFTDDDMDMAQLIAGHAAVAIENANLLEQTRKGLMVQRKLNLVATSISSGLDLGKILGHVARHAAEIVEADASVIALLDEENEEITFPIVYNLPKQLKLVTTPVGEGLVGEAIASGKSSVVNDYQGYEDRRAEFAAAGIQAVATVPLEVSGRRVGAIGAVDVKSGRRFSDDDIDMLNTISRQAAVAVENARLYEELSWSAQQMELRVKDRTEALSRMYEESKRKGQELEEANARLKEVDKLKSEFLANMSHELRTPLNSIIGFSKLILDGLDGGLNSEQRRDLEIVHTSGQALTRLIDDLLGLAKIEAGRVALDLRDEDPGLIVEDAVNACRSIVREKGLEISYEIPDGLHSFRVDASRISQVIRYLVENAVKFTEEGTIRVSIEQSTGKTIVAVADTGIGMEADQIDIVFERFHQVSPGLAEKGGMGLGLAISKRLVEMHGGTIGAESIPGEGSTFSFSIPDG
ncbi:MAG: GAF domain-containing sensor histidine kinase [Thermoleophilia bacterium]